MHGIPRWASTMVLAVFVLGWFSSIVAQVFVRDYEAPTGLNETMIAIVTAVFVAQQRLGSTR